jgi:hypothetical protein
MAQDDSDHDGDTQSQPDESAPDLSGPIRIATNDPGIEAAVETPSAWKLHPDATVCVQTTRMSEPTQFASPGVRTVVVEDQSKSHHGENRGTSEDGRGDRAEARVHERVPAKNAGRDNDDQRNRPSPRQQPSLMKHLLITASVALTCGVLGAMGFSYFFGSKSGGASPDHSKATSNSNSQKKSGPQKNEAGGESKQDAEGSIAQSSSSLPGFTSAQDADTLKQQILGLMQRIDQLHERVDRMSRPRDETPPVLQTMQIKLGDLTHAVEELSTQSAKVRRIDARLETFQEELKILGARIDEAQPDAIEGRTSGIVPSRRTGLPRVMRTDRMADNPTLDLGTELLERGQYASAREIFLRLQLSQSDDARVWYLSALAEGLTSGDWSGQAKRLAERGLECERTGHPSTASIDAALAMPTAMKGTDWLASLRRNVFGVIESRK